MKKTIYILIFFFLSINTFAHPDKKFDPEKFTREQEAFITKEAKLSPQDAAKFFPLFRELQQKQRAIYAQQRKISKAKPQNEKEASRLISNRDELDMRMIKLQSTYHTKFCKILPATKVYLCLQAEERYKRHIMNKIAQQRQGKNHKKKK